MQSGNAELAIDLGLGTQLDSATIEKGLTEINPNISFDAVVRRPSDYAYMASWANEHEKHRMSVLYNGNHVCSMDRGIVPENTLWEMGPGMVDIPMSEINMHDDTKVLYVQILPSDPFYHHALLKAQAKDDNFSLDDGKVFKYTATKMGKVKTKIIKAGWRHTFSAMIDRQIPGLTKKALFDKFGVDMGVD